MHKLFLAAVSVLAFTACNGFNPIQYGATLNGAKEVPPVITNANGIFLGTFNSDSKTLTITGEYQNLSGPATMAHIHGPADTASIAPIVFTLSFAGGTPDTNGTLSGSFTLTDAQLADLDAGKYYVNIHTAANPNGEIRGQITK